ncbi:recombinase family protein [Paraburkholderia acidipaludis]|uniref:recombinase family protein n=1 Tax=Paraburkholderia acidipaludis TaxID=660537 RepID=UPI00247FE074|nr:recombinase family protein [Paraburkholderia acidipaludis]
MRLVGWRLDRLGRSLPDLVNIVAGLEDKKIGFESITEKIKTTRAAGKLATSEFSEARKFVLTPRRGSVCRKSRMKTCFVTLSPKE